MDAEGKQRSKLVDIRSFSLRNPNNTADIFLNTKLYIEGNKRCAVYGINGSGKTCLFEAISSGAIKEFQTFIHVHHMKELEHNEKADAVSVLETVLASHPYRRVLLACRDKLELLIKDETDEAKLAKLKANLEYVSKEITTVHGDQAEHNAKGMLRVLGFDETGEKAPLSSLSGGLRMRVALACAFFIDPEMLLLDEPTNHLDLPSVLWLENRLRGYKGAFLLVTHDRTLLENVVTSVMLIQDCQLEYFDCDFKEFEKRKEENDKARDKMITQFLARNKNLNPMSPLIKTQMQYRAWQDKRKEREILLQGKFTFPSPPPLASEPGVPQSEVSLIKMENVRFSYDPEKLPFIFDIPISYEVKLGTRVGVMGPNGAGKSTWLKLITGKLTATEGTITTNPNLRTAYFGQHSTKELNLEDSAFEFMKLSFPKANEGVLKSHLKKTGVSDDIMESRMKNLSFSQRSCVIFAKLTFVPPHLLIMDEPTNFLDLDSVDSLIKAANKFQGGLIVVTHNRDFLKRTTKTFLSIVPMQFLEFSSMKDAERATYSFITALEEGRAIDVKNAITDNRGGGAIHTAEELAARQKKLTAQQQKAKDAADALRAEEERLAQLALEKEERRKAKLAKQRTDWKAGEVCWAPIKGKFIQVTVVRNVPSMGVTVELKDGSKSMVDAKKLKEENPEASGAATPEETSRPASAAKPANNNKPAGNNANKGRGGANAGRGGANPSRGGRGGRRN